MGRRAQAERPIKPSTPTLPPATSVPHVEIAARRQIQPYAQGALDKLCGLYATINALRLTLAEGSPRTKAECQRLFEAGINYLARKDGLDTALTEGMEYRRRHALAKYLAKQTSSADTVITIERPDHSSWTTVDDAFAWIEQSIHDGKPVLIALMGGLDHYSVVAAATSITLRLFDSTGLRFVRKSNCGFNSGYHHVPPNGLLRIAVHRTG